MHKIPGIKEQKKRLRAEYKELRQLIPSETRAAFDLFICNKYISLDSYRYANTVLLYSPLQDEIDTYPIALDALSKGKKIAYPRCINATTMVFHTVNSPDELLTGSYGISEPSPDSPLYAPGNDNSVCIIPAILYDRKGNRLGYGKGYYDRFLVNYKGVKAGLVYSSFIVDSLPAGRFDLKVDLLVTEKGVIIVAKN